LSETRFRYDVVVHMEHKNVFMLHRRAIESGPLIYFS